MLKQAVLFSLLFCCLPVFASSTDWPQFRGPNRDDISAETGLLKEWPSDGPKLLWKGTGIGSGYSTVSVVGSQIFTMGDKDGSSNVFGLNAEDGKIVWTAKVGQPGGNYDGTRGTPTFDGGKLYALGQFGDLVCLSAADGKEIWRKNLKTDFSGTEAHWNFAESPLVDGALLLCTPGGAKGTMMALDKTSGAPVWRCAEMKDATAYSSIVAAEFGGVHQFVQLTEQHVFGVDAKSGKLLWSAPRRGSTAVIPTPICYEDMVFVTSGYNVGCNCFKISMAGGAFTATELYASPNLVNHHGGALRIGENIYGHSDKGGWTCLEMKTGKVLWKNPGVGKGSVTYADGMLYTRAEGGNGQIALVEANPQGYKEHGRFNQPERSNKNSWPHPVVSNGRLYIRDQDNLFCYDVKGK